MSAGTDRLPRFLAATLALAGLVLVIGSVLIWGAGGFRPLPTSFARGLLGVSAGVVAAACFLGAGWLLASRVPRNPIGWLLLTMGLVFATMTPTALLVDAAHHAFRPAPAATLGVAWLLSSFSGPILAAAGTAAGLFFPDGRLLGPRWRWALALSIVGAALLAIATGLRSPGLVWYPTLPNPLAAPAAYRPVVSAAMLIATLLLTAGAVFMALSLAGRYRRGDKTVRAQLRWILYAGAAQIVVLGPFMVMRYVLPVGEALGEVLLALANVSLALVPIAAAVAITRYQLLGIDFIISRTLIYVPMMAILGGMYTASIATFQRIFVAVTGETSDAPLVITVFLVAAAFTPVRKGLEGVVDRWTHAEEPRGARPELTAPSQQGLTPEVARVAAEVIALRRFEERVEGASRVGPSTTPEVRLPIDTLGRVDCPAGGRPQFIGCLACTHVGGIITDPAAIICWFSYPPGHDQAPEERALSGARDLPS